MANPFNGTRGHEARRIRRHSALLASSLLAALAVSATALAAGTASVNSDVLTWIAPTTNADGSALADLTAFNVYHGQSLTAMMIAATVVAGARTFADNDLPPGTWYWYITAVNSFGVESAPSALVSKTIAPAATSTTAPANAPASAPGVAPASTTTGTSSGPVAPTVPGTSGVPGASGYVASNGRPPADPSPWELSSPARHRTLCMPRGPARCFRL